MGSPADRCLPFPRGQTWSDGGIATTGDQVAKDCEGKIYEVTDTEHGTGQKVKLRAVHNDSGGAITAARKFYEFSANALDFGRRITDVADTAGAVVKPLDDAYTVGFSIPDNDIFYVVESGPCTVVTEASAVNLAAGDAVATDASGLVNGAVCAAAEFPVGVIDVASTTTGESVVIHVNEGLAKPPAAG